MLITELGADHLVRVALTETCAGQTETNKKDKTQKIQLKQK
jgi:hypothetical protein